MFKLLDFYIFLFSRLLIQSNLRCSHQMLVQCIWLIRASNHFLPLSNVFTQFYKHLSLTHSLIFFLHPIRRTQRARKGLCSTFPSSQRSFSTTAKVHSIFVLQCLFYSSNFLPNTKLLLTRAPVLISKISAPL